MEDHGNTITLNDRFTIGTDKVKKIQSKIQENHILQYNVEDLRWLQD